MGCYVKDLKIPRWCAECDRDLAAVVGCVYTKRLVPRDEHDTRSGRHPECPLLPLYADVQLISLDDAFETIDHFRNLLGIELATKLKAGLRHGCVVYYDTRGRARHEDQTIP